MENGQTRTFQTEQKAEHAWETIEAKENVTPRSEWARVASTLALME